MIIGQQNGSHTTPEISELESEWLLWASFHWNAAKWQHSWLCCTTGAASMLQSRQSSCRQREEFTFWVYGLSLRSWWMMPGGHYCMQTLLNISGVYEDKVSPVLFPRGDTHNFDFCNLVRSYIKSILLGPFPVCRVKLCLPFTQLSLTWTRSTHMHECCSWTSVQLSTP